MSAPRPDPSERRTSRSGHLLVLGLLVLGAAGALVAKRYRIPGSAPRLRMFPAGDDEATGGIGWTLPPGKEVPARAVVRLRVVDAVSGDPVPGVELTGPGGATARDLPDGTRLLELGRPSPSARPEAVVRVRRPGGAEREAVAPLRVSTREDALDAPAFRLALPR